MVRYLQKRRFRLATRWKHALRKPGDLHRAESSPFKNMLIFRAFDDVMRELKAPAGQSTLATSPAYWHQHGDESGADAGDYVAFFLAGRKVIDDFINEDPAFSARFDATSRAELRTACDRVLMRFVDRELTEREMRRVTASTGDDV